ncbi:molybdopterin-binding protein [Methanospirillum stamsii]|uniref:MoaB/Mog domain-containing protein n=1 Tax=Methanospirillum stamsii TaxID=1277351 RepID=A0A2V2N7N3_9EURY|nr:molybdopterin-binding protein [Methanospirillum stamsii]PWR76032.1 hypothetical protein DLD82_01695 [Methanospirillum stamsii]
MSRYLTLIPYLAAQKILKNSAKPKYQVKTILVTESSGLVTYEPVFSRLTVPPGAISQRDGYAANCSETLEATDKNPVRLEKYSWVHTGSPLPDGYDCVIMQEDTRTDNSGVISIIKPARPGQHIQKKGSEIHTGKMILPAGHRINPEDIGAMVGYGITSVQVKSMVAGLIPTGDELKEPCIAPGPGEVIASNSPMMAAYLKELGITSISYPIVPDDPEKIREAIEVAVRECSFVIISGGSSTGIRDHTSRVLGEIGGILYHGVAIKPGKSTLAAIVDEIPVFGLPGTPGGALAVLRELILPWLSDSGHPVPIPHSIEVTLAESVPSELGTDDFVQMVVGRVHDRYCAALVPRGGGQMASVKSNGILHIPRNCEGWKEDKTGIIELTRLFPHPDNILLFTGETDPILDFLDQFLRSFQMELFARKTSWETTLISMKNRKFHGGVVARPRVKGRYLSVDHSLLSEEVKTITLAEREYILASRELFHPETMKGKSCPTLLENSFLSAFMQEYFLAHDIDITQVSSITPVCVNEQDIVYKIRSGEIEFGPCPAFQASEYDLVGPVIGCISIDLMIREEDIASDQMKRIIDLLSSDEWKDTVCLIPGYSSKRSGQISSFP